MKKIKQNNNIFINADDYGRSRQISENIIKCIESGFINSVSIMMGSEKNIYTNLNKYNIKKKLHINLTDFTPIKEFEYTFIGNLTFMKILFLKKNKRKYIYKEIDSQLEEYTSIYGLDDLIVDGHQHIQVIPWIYKYLIEHKKYNINEIRLPDEKFFLANKNTLFKLKLYRNLIAFFLLKILIRFALEEKLYSPPYSGMIYSGFYNQDIMTNNIIFMKDNYDSFEIAFHPGYTTDEEINQFAKVFFKYYSDNARKVEFQLGMNKDLIKFIN